ncbi:Alpha/Beta hydrolase protein [Sparassis latifolia]
MPYVDIVTREDYASIFYITNTPTGSVSSFDPSKPTVVMMHPLLLGSAWTYPQTGYPRLHSDFNIICFDTRSSGQSLCKASGEFDLWVIAADLALAFHHLGLPPAHIFTPELYAYASLRFAALFPEHCLSVTLCNVPAQSELRRIADAWEELSPHWTHAEDLESMEYCIKEVLDFFTGPDNTDPEMVDLHDDLAVWWQTTYPPFKRSLTRTNFNLIANRVPMTSEELAAVRCPLLIIQAERSETHPKQYAEELANALINVPGGASLYLVKTSHAYLSLCSSSIVNQVFLKWLRRQPAARSDLRKPMSTAALSDRMMSALEQIGQWRRDPGFTMEKNPLSPIHFSCLSKEVCKSQEEMIASFEKGERAAFSPLGMDGRPLRKYSERKAHWLDGGPDGFSYTDPKRYPQMDRGKQPKYAAKNVSLKSSKRDLAVVRPEPLTEKDQLIPRSNRANVEPANVVEKNVVKGSMARVVANSSTALPRLLNR